MVILWCTKNTWTTYTYHGSAPKNKDPQKSFTHTRAPQKNKSHTRAQEDCPDYVEQSKVRVDWVAQHSSVVSPSTLTVIDRDLMHGKLIFVLIVLYLLLTND